MSALESIAEGGKSAVGLTRRDVHLSTLKRGGHFTQHSPSMVPQRVFSLEGGETEVITMSIVESDGIPQSALSSTTMTRPA